MKWFNKKVQIKEGTIIDGEDYSGLTGETLYVGDNGIWLVEFDEESISKFSYEYIQECKLNETEVGRCYFEELDLIFLEN